ncbi:MAG: DUF3298 and DUF4163 domain-containing protein [Chitinophagales bacterium]|nr:DUF3298 and DUF4163 domain-containing protein [Chitinophagales bacterium]
MKKNKNFLLPFIAITGFFLATACKEKGLSDTMLKADSIRYETVDFDINDPRYDGDIEFQSNYKVSYPKITDDISQEVKEKINTEIAGFILDTNVAISHFPDIPQMAQKFFDDYYHSYDDSMRFAGWSVEKNTVIASKVGPLLTLAYSEFSFMGGAHPNSTSIYKVIDLNDGKLVKLADIIDETKMDELNTIRLTAFEKQKNDLEFMKESDWKNYLFSDEFKAGGNFNTNENFKVSKDAVSFFYNAYEIAPYAFGSTDLKVALTDLQPILNKKSPYYKYLKR